MRAFAKNVFCASLLCVTTFVHAQNKQEILVERITPTLQNGALVISADFRNLFSRKIVGTIQSGLPSIVQIEIRLQDENDRVVLTNRISRTITYDIWDERYFIELQDSTQVFSDFDACKQAVLQLRNAMLPVSQRLVDAQPYTANIRVGIVPISGRQADKITDWLLDPNQTEESMAAEDRDSGFQLNLTKLVSFFVSSNKKSRYASAWFSSSRFRISDLRR